MPKNRVVQFPGTSSLEYIAVAPASPRQRTLFDQGLENRGKIVFLDIRWLAEDTLLALVARNAVTALVDLRPRPVFDRPRFRHRHVVHYLFERDVHYLEYAMVVRGARGRSGCDDMGARIAEYLLHGLTLCLYDEAARSAGWLDEIRHVARHAPGYLAEMHPRALAGVPPAPARDV